jgi:ABC-2 type transport system permease protein
MLTALVKKELLALTRDVHGLAALFLMPVMFIVIMSLALKDVYNPPLASLPYAVISHDPGELAQSLRTLWQREHGPAQTLPADWQARLRGGHLKYVLVLEAGLSDELALPSLPEVPRIRLLTDPGLDGNLFNSLKAELAGAAGELKARTALSSTDAPAPPPGASMMALVQAERHASSGPRPTSVQQNVPAWLVFGMFFVIASLANLFVQERSSGTLARLRSLGVPRTVLLLSKALPYLGVNAVQAALMLAVGAWTMPLIGGDALSLRGIDWAALLLALASVSLAAVSLSLALACAVRTHAQAAAIGPILNVLMAAVGGIMVPKFVMPGFMQGLAELSPMNWGLEALLTVLLRGGDLTATLPHALRLTGFAAVMLLLALLLFRKSAP